MIRSQPRQMAQSLFGEIVPPKRIGQRVHAFPMLGLVRLKAGDA